MNITRLKQVLRQHNVHLHKRLGQNFLLDENMLAAIVRHAELVPADTVLEIGAGTGQLTRHLAGAAGRVVAVEIVSQLLEVCREYLGEPDSVRFVRADVLWNGGIAPQVIEALAGAGAIKVVSNLPYSISTPVICALLDGSLPVARLVLTVQKEVAQRIVAEPGSKQYGMLSVVAQVHGNAQIARIVSRQVFWPVPQVDSAIVDIVPNRTRLDRIRDYGSFHRIARAIFNHRRKTLLGSFDAERLLRASGRDAAQTIIDAGFDPQVRGEKLSVDAMINLANALSERDLLSD